MVFSAAVNRRHQGELARECGVGGPLLLGPSLKSFHSDARFPGLSAPPFFARLPWDDVPPPPGAIHTDSSTTVFLSVSF